jgi:hypothetical protein
MPKFLACKDKKKLLSQLLIINVCVFSSDDATKLTNELFDVKNINRGSRLKFIIKIE